MPSEAILAALCAELPLDPDELALAGGRVPQRYLDALAADPVVGLALLRRLTGSNPDAPGNAGRVIEPIISESSDDDYPARCQNVDLALAATRERVEEWDRAADPHGWWHQRPQLIALHNEVLRVREVVDAVREFRAQYGRFWQLDLTEAEAVDAAAASSEAWATVVALLDQLDDRTDPVRGER